ncbi:MAG: N-acetylneuraminate synthase [Candidatus Omnitrophica bacterium]|nr:N-acetylneuraminate synthase [Candidatus Omnitrophota bacterium]
MKSRVIIIAEAGINHNGNLQVAKKLIDVAAQCGADMVKFQAFKAQEVASPQTSQAPYQTQNTRRNENQQAMLRRYEINFQQNKILLHRARSIGIGFLSSAFDLGSIDMLNRLRLPVLKIPSGEITNLPYLKKIGGLRKKLILSTGMSDLKEIRRALDILCQSGTRKRDIIVLHCHTEYPTSPNDVNLSAMLTIKNELGVRIGYSDHTLGIEIPVAAVAMGASVIEKHFTLDRNQKGPDHPAALEPHEFRKVVAAIRNVERAMGDGRKSPTKSELKNRVFVRKSIVAAKDIRKGESFTEENLTVKRPGSGISPMQWDKVLGRAAAKAFTKDELIIL